MYNEILGFTEDEVKFVISEAGIEPTLIKDDIEYLYDGYMFHVDAEKKLYNSTMINHFLLQLQKWEKIERLVDSNLKTDYNRIKMMLKKPENIEKLEQIIEFGKISSIITDRFSIEKIHEQKNFLSLLYYMGLVTIDKGTDLLRIPNYSIKTIYWEYMENIIMEQNPKMAFDPSIICDGLKLMAFNNDYNPFFKDFQNNFVSQLSNRDLEHFSEKNIKLLLLSILFQTNYYLPISETENSKGYTDIYLKRRDYLYPGITTDWVWELKYIKQADTKKTTVIEKKKQEALTQLQRYKTSTSFQNRTDVRYLMIVFVGKKDCIVEELV
jgi:hypothetical protein